MWPNCDPQLGRQKSSLKIMPMAILKSPSSSSSSNNEEYLKIISIDFFILTRNDSIQFDWQNNKEKKKHKKKNSARLTVENLKGGRGVTIDRRRWAYISDRQSFWIARSGPKGSEKEDLSLLLVMGSMQRRRQRSTTGSVWDEGEGRQWGVGRCGG